MPEERRGHLTYTSYLFQSPPLLFPPPPQDFSEHTDTFGLTQELESKAAVLDALAPAFARYGGVSVEDFVSAHHPPAHHPLGPTQ